MGDRRLGIEGYDRSRWILLDYGDVVVHLFDAETRAYYGLEDSGRRRSGWRGKGLGTRGRDWGLGAHVSGAP